MVLSRCYATSVRGFQSIASIRCTRLGEFRGDSLLCCVGKVLLVIGLLVCTPRVRAGDGLTRLRTPAGVEFTVIGEKPPKPVPTLFIFALDAQTTLTSADFNRIGAALRREGFLCVSLDAPCHGADNAEQQENALVGWRMRVERGEAFIEAFTSRCTAVLDHLASEGWTDPERVAAAGTSRGGFLALHFAAAEPRVRAAAAFAPVTRLRALGEFDGVKNPDAADALSLVNVSPKLTDKHIVLYIGENDRRVGTEHAIQFARTLPALELHVTKTEGHRVLPIAHTEAAEFIAERLSAPRVQDVGSRACLFLDDRFVAEQSGLTRTFHPGRPLPEPAIVGDAWDQWPHLFGSVVFDRQEKLYRMWYSSIREGMFYAESRDGRAWTKPKLGLHDFNGSKENNLVMPGVSLPNVILDPHDEDPAGRFKLFAWDHTYYNKEPKEDRANGHTLFRSRDGIHWEAIGKGIPGSLMAPDERCANFITPDTNQVIWDPLAKRYLATFRTYPKRWEHGEFEQGRRRSIGITTAEKITGPWRPIVTRVVPDEEDDRAAARAMRDVPADWAKWAELYSMPTFTYGNHYIGLLSLIHVARSPDGKMTTANAPGGGDLQLAFSDDGMAWSRPADRPTLVAPSNAAGLHPTYAACSSPLEMGDEIWIYYAEANSSHPTAKDPRSQIRAAAWRKDGFASLATTGDTPGGLTTPALAFTGGELQLNVEVEHGGEVRVEVLGVDGKTHDGYSLIECDPLKAGDEDVARIVSWRGNSDVRSLAGKPVRLRLALKGARLYGFRFSNQS